VPETHTSKKVAGGKPDPNLYLSTEDKIDQRRMENRQRPLTTIGRILHPIEKKEGYRNDPNQKKTALPRAVLSILLSKTSLTIA